MRYRYFAVLKRTLIRVLNLVKRYKLQGSIYIVIALVLILICMGSEYFINCVSFLSFFVVTLILLFKYSHLITDTRESVFEVFYGFTIYFILFIESVIIAMHVLYTESIKQVFIVIVFPIFFSFIASLATLFSILFIVIAPYLYSKFRSYINKVRLESHISNVMESLIVLWLLAIMIYLYTIVIVSMFLLLIKLIQHGEDELTHNYGFFITLTIFFTVASCSLTIHHFLSKSIERSRDATLFTKRNSHTLLKHIFILFTKAWSSEIFNKLKKWIIGLDYPSLRIFLYRVLFPYTIVTILDNVLETLRDVVPGYDLLSILMVLLTLSIAGPPLWAIGIMFPWVVKDLLRTSIDLSKIENLVLRKVYYICYISFKFLFITWSILVITSSSILIIYGDDKTDILYFQLLICNLLELWSRNKTRRKQLLIYVTNLLVFITLHIIFIYLNYVEL